MGRSGASTPHRPPNHARRLTSAANQVELGPLGVRLQTWLEGCHAHLVQDEGSGWIVVSRHEVLDPIAALSSPSRRIRRLAKAAALRNPVNGSSFGPVADEVTFIWPQRGSDKGG
jgi:hypothetical protein